MKSYTKIVLAIAALVTVSAIGFGTAFGYGGGGGNSSGSQGYINRTYPVLPVQANPRAVIATQKGRVLGASAFNFTKQLEIGMRGGDVVELQNLLAALGHFKFGKSTGFFGSITKEAVKAFQLANEIPTVGRVGPMTLEQLNTK